MNIKISVLILTALLSCSSFAGIYNDNYEVIKNSNEINSSIDSDFFMHGDFEKIIRFDKLQFDDNELDEESEQYFKTIVKTVKEYIGKGEAVRLTIIGHTSAATDDKNEAAADSATYANKIQNLFRFSLDSNSSENLSKSYAQSVQNKILKESIDKNITIIEYRGGKDMAFNDACKRVRELSNRVMVTLYVLFPNDSNLTQNSENKIEVKIFK